MTNRRAGNKEIYLGKSGKVYGPISQVEFDQLVDSGDIDKYRWIWDLKGQEWKPLDPPPPPLVQPSSSQKPSPSISREILAVCHDQRAVISGRLDQITETGCELKSADRSASPRFGHRSSVLLNLLDPKSGRTVNVQATLSNIRKISDGWSYQIRWDQFPSL